MKELAKPKVIGSDDFKDLILHSKIFVDKSLFIKEILEDPGKIILITRPRRWGKTLNMDMLRKFLEVAIDDQGNKLVGSDNFKLFIGGTIALDFGETATLKPLKIAQYPDIIKRQNHFPVIFITFKNAAGETYQDIEQGIKTQLRKLFEAHSYLSDSDQLKPYDKTNFNIYLSGKINKDNIKNSLSTLTILLYKHYKQKVWVLIDEYDTPINSAYRNFGDNVPEFQRVVELFKGIMQSTFKIETGMSVHPVERGVITGIVRIAKSELFSSLNNVREYSVLDDNFSEHYGFSQVEVDQLFEQVKITKSTHEDIKNWYNGYKFGNKLLYNPYSIMNCLADEGALKNHWLESGGLKLLDKVLLSDKIQDGLQKLVQGESLYKRIYKQISLYDLESDSNTLYSLLLFAGYLNAELVDFDDQKYRLAIPNQEVKQTYIERIQKWVASKLKMDMGDYDDFVGLLTSERLDQFKEKFSEYLLNSTSYHDLIKEQDYHNLIGGILVPLTRKYIIESNKESGLGRFDHMLIPKDGKGKNSIIIEYKIAKNQEELTSTAGIALNQIINSKYHIKVKEYPQVKKIINVGIAFCGKLVDIQYQIDTI